MRLRTDKSDDRKACHKRDAFCQVVLLSSRAIVLAVLYSGCASGNSYDRSGLVVDQPTVGATRKDGMERLRQDVDRLIATDFRDMASIAAQLRTQLGTPQLDGERELRVSETGMLSGENLRRVELINALDNPSRGKLVIDFAPPGPDFVDVPWASAVPNPPHPDAADSPAYWTMMVAGTAIYFVLSKDQEHLVHIVIDKL